jgi:hypothetical protein
MATEKKRGGAGRPAPEPEAAPEAAEAVAVEVTTILIERRDEVATIQVSDEGDANAITLAYATAAEYIAANFSDGKELNLEFEFKGVTFYAGTELKEEAS